MIQKIKPYWEQVKDNTWCIVTGYARIPVYRLGDGRAIMIDSGWDYDGENIIELLESENLRLVAVLTSHAHPDHAGNHWLLREHFGAELYMTAYASATCQDPVTMFNMLHARTGFRGIRDRMKNLFAADHIIPWEDGELSVEGATFRYLKTHGHCSEHLAFITPDNVAYLGDAILSKEIMATARMHYCNCLEVYLESVEKIGRLNCDKYIIAHNGVVDDIRETVQVCIDTVAQRAQVLRYLAKTPATVDELAHRFLLHTKADLSSVRSVHGVQYNTLAYVSYMYDKKMLKLIFEDGFSRYVSTDSGE